MGIDFAICQHANDVFTKNIIQRKDFNPFRQCETMTLKISTI